MSQREDLAKELDSAQINRTNLTDAADLAVLTDEPTTATPAALTAAHHRVTAAKAKLAAYDREHPQS